MTLTNDDKAQIEQMRLSIFREPSPRSAWRVAVEYMTGEPESIRPAFMKQLYRTWPQAVQYGAERKEPLWLVALAKQELTQH